MTHPQHIDIDTPQGELSVTWPQPQPIYGESLEPVGSIQQQDPTPTATLNGHEITVEHARAILEEMAYGRKN
jgi:hypothetical protein